MLSSSLRPVAVPAVLGDICDFLPGERDKQAKRTFAGGQEKECYSHNVASDTRRDRSANSVSGTRA